MGVDGYTSNSRPVVGWLPSLKPAYLASGFSGRGYKIALPIAATVAAELLKVMGMTQHEILDALTLGNDTFFPLVSRPRLDVVGA